MQNDSLLTADPDATPAQKWEPSTEDATMLQTPEREAACSESQECCLVQIYPADVVDGMLLLDGANTVIGRDEECDVYLLDASVSRRHAEVVSESNGYVLRDLGSTNGTLVNGRVIDSHRLQAGDTVGVGSFLFKYLSAGSVESQYHETVYSALTRDALTGTFNKRYMLESMSREISRTLRQKGQLAVLMLDIDHFKSVNDTHGHLVGDEVLREFGGRVSAICRDDDMLARYGGEEFCLLMCGTSLSEAKIMAERCRAVVADTPFTTAAGPLDITASFGLHVWDASKADSPVASVTLIEQADQRLYDAKRSGRNRVCC